MRQICNFVVAVNAEIKTEPGEFEKWEADVNRPPARYFNQRGFRARSAIDPSLEQFMGFGGVGR